jgi:hypothetical protein
MRANKLVFGLVTFLFICSNSLFAQEEDPKKVKPNPVEEWTITSFDSGEIPCEQDPIKPATASICYFDVPDGTVVKIESVSGFDRKGNVDYIAIQVQDVCCQSTYVLPETRETPGNFGPIFFYSALTVAYAKDTNAYPDSDGVTHDFRILVRSDGSGTPFEQTDMNVTGRVFKN